MEGDSGLNDLEEVTSEVTPKKRGRPKKVETVVMDASPPEAPEPVEVVVKAPLDEAVFEPRPSVQSVPAQTLAEIEAGTRALKRYAR